jgi:hypothetical protein
MPNAVSKLAPRKDCTHCGRDQLALEAKCRRRIAACLLTQAHGHEQTYVKNVESLHHLSRRKFCSRECTVELDHD